MQRYPSNRINRLLGPLVGKALVVPIDDSLIAGPIDGLKNDGDTLRKVVEGSPDAILGFTGQFDRFDDLLGSPDVGRIANLTASTVGMNHTKKVLISTVRAALMRGCDAVAVHVNFTSAHQPEMLRMLGKVIEEADQYGLPTLAIAYPRTEGSGRQYDNNYDSLKRDTPEQFADLISASVRLACDLGAAVVKCQYPGSTKLLQSVCDDNRSARILVAGGPTVSREEALNMVGDIAKTSVAGISFGRNTYNRDDPLEFMARCRELLKSSTGSK